MNVNAQNFRAKIGRCINRWHQSTIERHSLSQPLRAASSLREGAGVGGYHSPHRPETATLRAIFIAPTKAQNVLHFTIWAGSEGDGILGQLMPGEVGDELLGGGGGVLVDEAGGEGQVAGDFRRGFALSQLP